MEPNNEKLIELMKIDPSNVTPEVNSKFLEELKKSQLIIPIEITSNSFNFDEMEVGETMSLNEPLRFKPVKLTNDEGKTAFPLFTSSEIMEEINLQASCIAMFTEDIVINFAEAKDEFDLLLINPGTNHFIGMEFNAFLNLFEKDETNKVRNLFEEKSVPLNDNYKFFLREKEPNMKNEAINGIFTADLPFNVSTNEDFHKDYPYLNILLVKEGKRVLYVGEIVDTITNFDLIIEAGIRFKLVDELDDYTFVWESI